MGYLGIVKLGANLTFYANTHTPSTGAAVDADAPPEFRVYEDETATPLLTGTMALLDDTNTVGFYSEQIAVTGANGFEAGKSYCVRITGVVDDVTGAEVHQFDVSAALLDDIEAQTDDIGAAGAGLTAIPTIANVTTVDSTTTIGATGLAAIAAAVWDALTSGLTTVGSIGAYILNYLDAKVSTVGGGTTEGIAAAVWDYLTSAATTAGSLGALIVTKLGYLTSGTTVTVSSPVASGLNVTTIQGDDYKAADGRAIEWTVASTATLTGGTVAVIVEGVDTYTGSVVDETTIRLELTAAQTAAIPVGPHRYQVIHTQSVALGEDVTTLVQGTWTSARRYTE